RLRVLKAMHDNLEYRGLFATCSALLEQFWWPQVSTDIVWYLWICHLCQIHQLTKVLIPPTVAMPAPLFSKIYVDTMFMPPSNNKIVMDNGPPILKAVTYLAKKYNLHHIRISGYNKRTNGIIKRPYFNVCQALFKAVDGDQSRWSTATYSVFWSEHVTVCKRMGCSPYFATTSTHPLLPANIVEVTYLQLPPNSLLLTTDLIACRAIDLQRCQEDLDHLHSQVLSAHHLAAICFKTEHTAMICNYNFKTGDLVLMRNTKIEVTHKKKMKPHYLGPLVVISCNCGGAYIICELDGSVLHCPIAAFCLIPYFAREHITVPSNAFDIDTSQLRELEQTELVDNDDTGDITSEEEI
ncbi:hypothetical protein J132_05572, partial [Termitomyces sp. J132]